MAEIVLAMVSVALAAVSLGIAAYNRGESRGFEEGRQIGNAEGCREAADEILDWLAKEDREGEETEAE